MHLMRPSGIPVLRSYQHKTVHALLHAMAVQRGETFTVMFPRQAGKNEVAATLVACLLRLHACSGGSVVVCAPTYQPQTRISVERVRQALAAKDALYGPAGAMRARENVISVGRARAIFLGASPEAHVAGHTASLALVADEAQEIDAGWFDRQFRPMAASTGAPTVLFGTPWDGATLLERAAAANVARDRAQAGVRNDDWLPFHHQVSWEEVADCRPPYGDYVRHERERLGANHPIFLSQYELVTAESSGRLLSPGQLALLEGDHPHLPVPLAGERYAGGIDFAGEGEDGDATVLTIGRLAGGRCEVVEHVAWRGAPYGSVENDVAAIARRWRLERLCADATGLGSPIAARLARELGPRLEAVTFTAESKSALGYALIAAANTGRLVLYADNGSREAAACRSELGNCGASFGANGRLSWAARRGHDDYVASLALCLRAAESLGAERLAAGRRRE